MNWLQFREKVPSWKTAKLLTGGQSTSSVYQHCLFLTYVLYSKSFYFAVSGWVQNIAISVLCLSVPSYILKSHVQTSVAILGLPVNSSAFTHQERDSSISVSWMTWVINPAVSCHYFPPGLQLLPQPLRGLLPVSLLGEQRHDGCEQFAWDCCPTASLLRFEPGPFCAWVQHANHSATEPPIVKDS